LAATDLALTSDGKGAKSAMASSSTGVRSVRTRFKSYVVVVVLIVAAFGSFAAHGEQNGPGGQAPGGNSSSQNFLAQHEIGRRFHIDLADLPTPKTGPIVTDRPLIVPYTGQVPQVPSGFVATPFATGLVNPRRLLVLPNGDVLVAEQSAGYLTLLRDDGSGRATWIDRHVEDLNKPYGLAWRDNHVLVADQDGIWSVPHNLGALRAGSSETKRVIKYRRTNVSRHQEPTALR
jgi:hypothetical protein